MDEKDVRFQWENRLIEIWKELSPRSRKNFRLSLHRIQIKFFPYKNGNSSIRFAKGTLEVKFHTAFQNCDDSVSDSLVRLLFSRLLGLKVQEQWRENIHSFLDQNLARQRTRKVKLHQAGAYFDLQEIFSKIATEYFREFDLSKLQIGWSNRNGFRRLGSFERESNSIRISPVLDNQSVPLFVMEHLVHHEILHYLIPVKRSKGKHIIHGFDFKRREREYADFSRADLWIKREYQQYLRDWHSKNGIRTSSLRKRYLYT
ncbi:hypothetical protein CH373_15300 [Leptospira perolatii]|uniref:SprT-like domain-containing protein n=1 Tax=Leptospira perolatii TaxID=2023191 RepID=A0A2M9ZJQ2_9LEPT|nr:SprT-like domain-containing protein [Leptospira perolatii]PJZ69460.1 hypothetical protein CH360_10640 [Leptospira perolatii]PJZ72285.1 hypothetical protein CH373_15300 [Leptospira perolatii]